MNQFAFIIGRHARSTAMPILFLLSGPKMGFSPTGATHCPDRCEISRLSGQKCGNTAPKTGKISILARNLYLRGDSFAIFLWNFEHLYTSTGSLATYRRVLQMLRIS